MTTTAPTNAADNAELAARRRDRRNVRREEGFADLVALAWTWRAHPSHYDRVLGWLERYREDAAPGEHHDTRLWLELARDPAAFAPTTDLYGQVQVLWGRAVSHAASAAVSVRPPVR